MNLDVIGFGALNVDRLYKVSMIAREEEEAYIMAFNESPGGSAANTIVGLARLGVKTGFIGKVGRDREGKLVMNDFRKEKIDTSGITISADFRSGVVMGYVDGKGERALYVAPGANDHLGFEEIDLEYANNTEFLHLSSFVGENPFEAQKELVSTLSDTKISFDPGALYARKGLASLKQIIERSHVVMPNEKEVKLLTGLDYKSGSRMLIKMGVGIVAVKLGGKGCYITDGKQDFLVESFEKDLVDTTGAGDAFCAGFLYGLIKGRDPEDCGKLGNFVAARCVSKMGARTGLPRISDIKRVWKS